MTTTYAVNGTKYGIKHCLSVAKNDSSKLYFVKNGIRQKWNSLNFDKFFDELQF